MDPKFKLKTKVSAVYIIMAFFVIMLIQELIIGPMKVTEEDVPYSQFRKDLTAGKIAEAVVEDENITYSVKSDAGDEKKTSIRKTVRVEDGDLVAEFVAAGAEFKARLPKKSLLGSLLGWILPVLPFALIWWFLMKRMGGGKGGMLSVGKSKATEITGKMTGVTFEDVAGIDQVEEELKEIIEFLKDSERFVKLGAKLPKGVLLVGPPGTGKTLLAKATAGEADVPFFSMSGSEFVEMFVGVGASRVRDLFEQAKAKAPCIIFIDEIDAVGQSRSGGMGMRTNDEREHRTLNTIEVKIICQLNKFVSEMCQGIGLERHVIFSIFYDGFPLFRTLSLLTF
jgi:cell division protease FtsH